MKKKQKLDLGTTAKDKITGFEGTLTGFASYLTGCNQYLISPKVKEDNSYVNGQWFDEHRLDIIDSAVLALEPTEEDGAMDEAPTY